MARTIRKQIVTYVMPDMEQKIMETVDMAKAVDSRYSVSMIAEKCLLRAIDEIQREFRRPPHGGHGKQRTA